jgi:anti-sigma B factor antagonist
MNQKNARAFLRDIMPILKSDRPQIVFDLSAVKQLDVAGVDVVLEAMNTVMKQDGDLKLAALSDQAAVVLELTRTDRLFEIYETSTDAVRSFSSFLPNTMRRYEYGRVAA